METEVKNRKKDEYNWNENGLIIFSTSFIAVSIFDSQQILMNVRLPAWTNVTPPQGASIDREGTTVNRVMVMSLFFVLVC